jgi:hypothetical protein
MCPVSLVCAVLNAASSDLTSSLCLQPQEQRSVAGQPAQL